MHEANSGMAHAHGPGAPVGVGGGGGVSIKGAPAAGNMANYAAQSAAMSANFHQGNSLYDSLIAAAASSSSGANLTSLGNK